MDDRRLLSLHLPDLASLPRDLDVGSEYFACLILCDARGIDADVIGAFAEQLLERGAVYVCAWGPDCERVHDIFDEVIVGGGPDIPRFTLDVMTTWHDDEDLDDALWYLLECARPSEELRAACRSAVAVSVGNPEWASRAREALREPEVFCDQVIDRDGGATGETNPGVSP